MALITTYFTILSALGILVYLLSLVIVPKKSVCMLYRFGKFKKSYGSGVHVVLDSIFHKKIILQEGMIVRVASDREIEVGTHLISANFLEQPVVDVAGIIIGFTNLVPRVTQKNVAEKIGPDSFETSDSKQKNDLMGRLLALVFSGFLFAEGYLSITGGDTVIKSKHGDGFKITGDWAIVIGVIYIVCGLLLTGLALGLIKRRIVK